MNDGFEKRLQHQSPRALTPAWRAEILVAADVSRRKSPHQASLLHQFYSALRTPHSTIKWGTLAAIWVIIFILNHVSRDTSPVILAKAPHSAKQMQVALQEQRKLLAELAEPSAETNPIERPKPAPRPHSQRRDEMTAV